MTRGFWRDPERYLDTYWRRIPGVWVHGDWASADADGFWFLHGRSDDTLNIAGKRIGPAELESAAIAHPAVREAAAIGVPHEVKGEIAWIFCCLLPGYEQSDELAAEIADDGGGRARQGVRSWQDRVRGRAAEDALGEDRATRGEGGGARRRSRRPLLAREPGVPRRDRGRPCLNASHSSPAAGAASARTSRAALAEDGWSVVVAARTRAQVEAVAGEIGGRALELDVSSHGVGRARRRRGGRGRAARQQRRASAVRAGATWELDPDEWWRVFEVNVRGAFLCARAAIPGMIERGARPDRERRQRAPPTCRWARSARARTARARPRCTASASCSPPSSRRTASRSSRSAPGSCAPR